jgi:ATP adenylyltransferase
MPYIRKHSDKTPCFLCDYRRTPRKDRPNLVLGRGETCFVVMNRFPYNVGHLMIAPYRHEGELGALTAPERDEMLGLASRAQKALDRAFRPNGYNLGINLGRVAGAGLLGHVHLHLVPRWDGDTNFMPVTAGTKVMPVSLAQAFTAIKRNF